MLDPHASDVSDASDVQRRGLRELRKLPGSGAAASTKAASTKRTLHDTLQKNLSAAGNVGCRLEGGDALPRPRQSRMSEPVSSSMATEQAKLFHAIGMDLLHSLPEAAHGYVQRALRTAPKESWLLSEIMGSACVTLNRLKRHSEALRMAEQACELLKRGQQPTVQLIAMLHNKSACHEYLGDNASALQARAPCRSTRSSHLSALCTLCTLFTLQQPPALRCTLLHPPLHPALHPPLHPPLRHLQATEKGLQLAGRMRLPDGDELVSRLEQSKAPAAATRKRRLGGTKAASHRAALARDCSPLTHTPPPPTPHPQSPSKMLWHRRLASPGAAVAAAPPQRRRSAAATRRPRSPRG